MNREPSLLRLQDTMVSLVMYLPRVVMTADNGQDFYYARANAAVEIDHEETDRIDASLP